MQTSQRFPNRKNDIDVCTCVRVPVEKNLIRVCIYVCVCVETEWCSNWQNDMYVCTHIYIHTRIMCVLTMVCMVIEQPVCNLRRVPRNISIALLYQKV
jgi:hypothetical protein